MTAAPQRAQVRFDRFAPSQIGREFGLRADARWLLFMLCFLAPWRTRSVRITITDLADETGLSRRATAQALDRLAKCGLITEVCPFGPGREGVIEIVAWNRLIVPWTGGGAAAKLSEGDSELAPDSRDTREATGESSAIDQRKVPSLRQQGREQGDNREYRATVAELTDSQNRDSTEEQPLPKASRAEREQQIDELRAEEGSPHFWDIPLTEVGICRKCGAVAVRQNDRGPLCGACLQRFWNPAFEPPRAATA